MKTRTNIREHFKPLQPTVSKNDGMVLYRELLPAEPLLHQIYCYWELKTSQTLNEPFVYRVVADGCIDIFLELQRPHENYVMGFCKTFTEFPLDPVFHYIGIRFLPTMFPQLFQINASMLSNRFERLEFVLPHTSAFLAKQLHKDLHLEEIKNILDSYFIERVNAANIQEDPRLYKAIDLILKEMGVLNIEKDLDTGISPRQLRRLFDYYVGDTAKTFAKVVRFQNILRAKPSGQSLQKNKLFYEDAYYDQAHFIKEFKNFYGVTPSKAFGR